MTAPFESLLPISLAGTLDDIKIFEAVPDFPTHIIKSDEAWGVELNWEMTGAAANFFAMLPEVFEVRLLLESIGGGVEYTLPTGSPLIVNYGPPGGGHQGGVPNGPTSRKWSNIQIVVPAGAINPGVYKMAVTVQLSDNGGPRRALVGLIEGILVEFYQALP